MGKQTPVVIFREGPPEVVIVIGTAVVVAVAALKEPDQMLCYRQYVYITCELLFERWFLNTLATALTR